VANLVYKRVSTDQQSTVRQDLVLDEAGIEDPVAFEEDPGTSSRLHPLQRPKFRELLTYARPGDIVHISEMFRLVRGTGHILDVLDVLHRDQVALRIHDGAFSAMDLTARHPRTGELLSTVKFMVQTLAAAGELQRDLQRGQVEAGGGRQRLAAGVDRDVELHDVPPPLGESPANLRRSRRVSHRAAGGMRRVDGNRRHPPSARFGAGALSRSRNPYATRAPARRQGLLRVDRIPPTSRDGPSRGTVPTIGRIGRIGRQGLPGSRFVHANRRPPRGPAFVCVQPERHPTGAAVRPTRLRTCWDALLSRVG
jgi:DNA invertase Pin-like site-specific DNA recombinase